CLGKPVPGFAAPKRRQTNQLKRPQLATPVSCYYVTLAPVHRNPRRSDRLVGGHSEMAEVQKVGRLKPWLQRRAAIMEQERSYRSRDPSPWFQMGSHLHRRIFLLCRTD